MHLPRAVPRSQLAPLRDNVLEALRRAGIGRREIPKSLSALPPFQQIGKLSSLVEIPDLRNRVVSPAVQAAVDATMPTKAASHHAQLLLSPPNQGSARRDGLNWHSDVSRSQSWAVPPVQVFVLIDDVDVHGGGTLLLSGSHLTSRDQRVEQRIRAALAAGRDGETELRGLGLSIVELSGKAGDAYLMDMRVLHTPSVNATARFRMVATVRFFAE